MPVPADDLPDVCFSAAAAALAAEHRANSRCIELQCHAVHPISGSDGRAERIYALEITRFARLDWTWEGARAFAGIGIDGDPGSVPPIWVGEVVQVDEVGSRLFVRTGVGVQAPCIGVCFVQPFDYLEALHAIYVGELAAHAEPLLHSTLRAAEGTAPTHPVPLPADDAILRGVWDHSRGYVWGPPGTGKTWSIGEQVAAAIAAEHDPDTQRATGPRERILVVSTTNLATDEVALSIARALRARGIEPTPDLLRRVGSGVDYERLRADGLGSIVDEADDAWRDELTRLLRRYRRAVGGDAAERAALWAQLVDVRWALSSGRPALDAIDARIVVTTAFLGLRGIARETALRAAASHAQSFSTIVIDECGLIPRIAAAALMLWASRRVVLVGDPRQLSPISRISRVLEPRRARWLAASAIAHLNSESPGVRQLTEQRRMCPAIRRAVSEYAYDGRLRDAPDVATRACELPAELAAGPRAIWYVLDEDTGGHLAQIRADRGPGGRSWVRRRSLEVVDRLLRAFPELATTRGLFVSPFVAQARELAGYFARSRMDSWRASTAHAQQGAQAEVVLVDTVHASSTAWSHDEWTRLINVAISRARELVIVLASRLEMAEPYLASLRPWLAPRVLRGVGGRLGWVDVPALAEDHAISRQVREATPTRLGAQLESRKAMRPILGAEQQRLCGLPIDGRPRLVRGVAGSGKTAVLANWLARRIADDLQQPLIATTPTVVWVVYANRSLAGLLRDVVETAWRDFGFERSFPWQRVELLHVLELLDRLEREFGSGRARPADRFDFEARADALLGRPIVPRCAAMFVDEAQDFGDRTLALLARLVEPMPGARDGRRAMHIFYDNAQNVYGRGTPRWVELGLDMKGRSSVMKESRRSTLPITELAFNLVCRLRPPDGDPDHEELVRRELVHRESRNGRPWWNVRFNEIDGPPPDVRLFEDRAIEARALAHRVVTWIRDDGVRPGDVRVLCNGEASRERHFAALASALPSIGVQLEVRVRDRFDRADDTVLLTTAHSFKGHDAEIVAVPSVDSFVANHAVRGPSVLDAALYVAMTRARSVLYVSATIDAGDDPTSPRARVIEALRTTVADQRAVPSTSRACTAREVLLEIVARVPAEHRTWLEQLARRHVLRIGVITATSGEVIAAPLFWLDVRCGGDPGARRVACAGREPFDAATESRLHEMGVGVLALGELL